MDQTWVDPRNAIPALGVLVPLTRNFQKLNAIRVKLPYSCSYWADIQTTCTIFDFMTTSLTDLFLFEQLLFSQLDPDDLNLVKLVYLSHTCSDWADIQTTCVIFNFTTTSLTDFFLFEQLLFSELDPDDLNLVKLVKLSHTCSDWTDIWTTCVILNFMTTSWTDFF